MFDPLHVAGLAGDVLAGAPGVIATPTRALSERDEFGALHGAPGLFSAGSEPTALDVREDLGHALCAWVALEDLL